MTIRESIVATDTQADFFAHLDPANQPETCLGQTFPNAAARREHFRALLAKKLKDPAFRAIEGFPKGSDEAILSLSDPPYYCACPNPWIEDFISEWKAGSRVPSDRKYEREPFASDVSEGKNDPIYNAHTYHTKVPHKAIMRYILHYTEPGDVVFDGFCGTGMTGVAAQMCGDRRQVESLGYTVDGKGRIFDPKAKDPKKPISRLGARRVILNDLSPAATFIASNYNTPVSAYAFLKEAEKILSEVEKECGWMYETQHFEDGLPAVGSDGKPVMGKINYVVWSDVYECPNCKGEVVFWDAAVDRENGRVKDVFECPHCRAEMTKRNSKRMFSSVWDHALGHILKTARQVPVLINYAVGRRRYEKMPDAADFEKIQQIDNTPIPYPFPVVELPPGKETSRNIPIGITHVHQFYTKRNLWTLAKYATLIPSNIFRFVLTGVTLDSTKMGRMKLGYYFNGGGGPFIPGLAGTLYIPSLSVEKRPIFSLENRFETCANSLSQTFTGNNFLQNTGSASRLNSIPADSIDYIFLDPPFGANINYSELNFIWESWLGVVTDNKEEAIENDVQHKGVSEYRSLMRDCLREAYRVLKPGRWMTVEFSNTSSAIWNSIQTALSDAGFIVANVSALDKKQGSFKAVTTPTAVKQGLVISAYKPDEAFQRRFAKEAETPDGVWDFVREHLGKLPVVKSRGKSLERVRERDPRIVYDKLLAYYIRNGFTVPMDAGDFQHGLGERFSEEDDMVFLPEQVEEYRAARDKLEVVEQGELFVTDERTAIAWLRNYLKEKPSKYQDVMPEFVKALSAWDKKERQLELKDLLEENFIRDEDGVWSVPDPRRAGDVEKKREASLLREYDTYSSAKKLKEVRAEALRAGFKRDYGRRDWKNIVTIARKAPAEIVETDEMLTWYLDQADNYIGE